MSTNRHKLPYNELGLSNYGDGDDALFSAAIPSLIAGTIQQIAGIGKLFPGKIEKIEKIVRVYNLSFVVLSCVGHCGYANCSSSGSL